MMTGRLLSTEAEDHIQPLETDFAQMIQNWQQGALTDMSHLLQAVYAPWGGGKTWLLQRWQTRWGGVLLDLKEDNLTAVARIREMQTKLANAPEKRILFLDNVPNVEDELTNEFEEEILQAELASGNLVIQALRQRDQVCWGGAIPKPHARFIPPLSPEGVQAVRRKFGLVSSFDITETMLFSEKETLPGLVQAWCEGRHRRQRDADTLRNYLQGWWQQSGQNVPQNFSTQLLPLAVLACQNTFAPRTMFATLSDLQKNALQQNSISFSENGLPFRLKMKGLGWMQPDGGWYLPIQTVLKTWLALSRPNVYSSLTSN